MMKKQLFSILLYLLCVASAVANPVTPGQAQQKAKAFLVKRGMAASATLDLAYQGKQQAHQNGAPAKDACYYVFNNGHNEGFVIVAGDDCAEDVLGYVTEGSFDADNIPQNMQVWLNAYANQIAWARNHMAPAQTDNDTEVARQVIAPMVKAHWDQGEPYNLKCPLYGAGGNSGERCVTGCVATAMAQVMYYHKWPRSYTTAIPAYTSNSVIGELAALPSVSFDWDNMSDCYSVNLNESQAKKNAVATLMRYCGQAVEMDYSPGGSGGYTNMIPTALSSYFGYENEASWIFRDDYTTLQWNNFIYNELLHARPVIYSADTSGGGGHAFICDGYDGHDMYHINWGWGGLCDGYFRLQALNPSAQGTGGSGDYGGYSLDQSAIICISPTVVTDNMGSGDSDAPGIETVEFDFTDPYQGWEELEDQQVSYNYNSSRGFSSTYVWYWYHSIDASQGYDVGLGLFDGDEMKEKIVVNENYSGPSAQYYANAFSLNFGRNLSAGTYQIRGIDSPAGSDEWKPSASSDRRYLEVVIAEGKCTISIVNKEIVADLEVTGVEQVITQSGNPRQLRVHLHNNANEEYNAPLYLLVDNKMVAKEGAFTPANDDDYVDFVFEATTGQHTIVVSTTPNSSGAIYNGKYTISNQVASPKLTVTKAELRNVAGGKQYGRLVEYAVTFKNNSSTDYDNQMTKWMYVKNTQGSFYGFIQSYDVSIAAGEEKTVTFTHELALGDVYWVWISDGKEERYCEEYNITVSPAFVSWTADGTRTAVAPASTIKVPEDAVAASFEDITNLAQTTIKPNANANTLYYLAHNATVPSALNGKNVVKGYEASNIVLTESSGFYVPQSFTASKISYTYKPTVGFDGKNGWQTITLPFGVQQVTSDGKAVDWYHGNETGNDKDFWVMRYTRVDGDKALFADLDTWMPNEPYIIAVPGNRWGKDYAMTDKNLQFSASNVKVIQTLVCQMAGNGYDFIGSTGEKTVNKAYGLNAKGNAFDLSEKVTVKPTEAYFVGKTTGAAAPTSLIISYENPDGIWLPVTTAMLGDADNDGLINIMDVTAVINYILGKMPSPFDVINADANVDGLVNISDVTEIINIILGK